MGGFCSLFSLLIEIWRAKVLRGLKALLIYALLFSSCAGLKNGGVVQSGSNRGGAFSSSGSSAAGSSFWVTTPENGNLVFIGAAASRTNREEAVRYALLDAARKVSLYLGVYGKGAFVLDVGAGHLDFNTSSDLELSYDPDYEKYIEEFEFDPDTDVLALENSVFVRVRWPAPVLVDTNFVSRWPADRPDWILNPPETVDGYLAAVGRSGSHSRSYSAVIASYENAIASLLYNKYSSIDAEAASVEVGGATMAAASNKEVAEGKLFQFYILEVWIDPADRSVWTLAIAKSDDGN
jgi:hypothetical protein